MRERIVYSKKVVLFCRASAPHPDLRFASLEFIYFGVGDFRFAPIVLPQKVSKKVNPSADGRFTRKTYAQLAKTVQTRSFVAQTGQFQTPTSLVFRFIGRGQSPTSCVQFNNSCISIENIY